LIVRPSRQPADQARQTPAVGARNEIACAIATIYTTHLALIRVVHTLDGEACSDAVRRALALLRRLPAPLGDADWPVMPDPVTREFFRLYARLTAEQRNALLVIMRRATRTGRGKAPSPRRATANRSARRAR
jgi:hypothetical protein